VSQVGENSENNNKEKTKQNLVVGAQTGEILLSLNKFWKQLH